MTSRIEMRDLATILETAKYDIRHLPEQPILYFEDDSLAGFAYICDTVSEIAAHWRLLEERFLAQVAPRLREKGRKAWNLYSVFLCREKARGGEDGILVTIEESLERTRKIARDAIATHADVSRALYPLLPIQHTASLGTDDAVDRLRNRLAESIGVKTRNALFENLSPAHLVEIAIDGDET